jgi:hypothetical protein
MVAACFKVYLKKLVGGTEDIHEKSEVIYTASGPGIVSWTVRIEKVQSQ